MNYKVQVKSEKKYKSKNYISPRRWSSYAIQVKEIMLLRVERILEIGPGNGVVTAILKNIGFSVETLDIDARVGTKYVGSITDRNLINKLSGKFDTVLACQIFEHIKYEDFLLALTNIKLIAHKVVMSLPYTEINSKFFHFVLKIPGLEKITLTKKIIYKIFEYEFNGEHYWEIGTKGYSLSKVTNDIKSTGWKIDKSFLNPDNPFHYFFVLSKNNNHENKY